MGTQSGLVRSLGIPLQHLVPTKLHMSLVREANKVRYELALLHIAVLLLAVWDDADFVVMHLGFDEETNGVCGDFRLLEKAISVWAEELWCCDDWKRPASCSYVNVAKWMWRRSALCRIGVERYWCMQICTMCRSGAVIGTGVWWSDPCSYNSSYTSNDRRSLTEPDQSPKAVQSPISCPRIHVFLSHSSFMYSNYNFDTNCIDLHTVKTQALVIPGLYVGWVLHVH